MSKNKVFKYSLKCEGESEKMFLIKLKTTILKNQKISMCKKHTSKINGTISIKDFIKTSRCCKQFIVIDKDQINEDKIELFKSKANNLNISLIITNPCFELILLSLFSEIKSEKNKDKIEKELAKLINVKKYKHKTENIQKLFDKAFRKEESIQKTLNLFEKNLNEFHKKQKSNFIDLFNFLKGDTNGKIQIS